MGKIPKRINFSVRTRASTGADLRLRLPFPQNGTTQPREQNNDAAGQRRPPPTDPARGHEDPHLARRRRSDHAHARRRGRIRATYRRTEREVGREKPRTAGNRVPSFFRIFAATGSTDAIAVFSLSQFSSCFFWAASASFPFVPSPRSHHHQRRNQVEPHASAGAGAAHDRRAQRTMTPSPIPTRPW